MTDASKKPLFVWLSLAFTVVGGAIGFIAAQYYQFRELELKQIETSIKTKESDLKRLERDDRIHVTKLEVIKQIKDANFALADAILIYLLKPLEPDATSFEEFRRQIKEAISTEAAKQPANTIVAEVRPPTEPQRSQSFPYQVETIRDKFSGGERLDFSNELIALYPSSKTDVVSTLVQSLIPETGLAGRNRYRINLYIVFTLARIPGGWVGTQQQFDRIKSLEASDDMRDSTFAARLREALKNRTPG